MSHADLCYLIVAVTVTPVGPQALTANRSRLGLIPNTHRLHSNNSVLTHSDSVMVLSEDASEDLSSLKTLAEAILHRVELSLPGLHAHHA